jgi:hypothetical protein
MSKVIELINENKAKEVIEVIDLPNSLLSKIIERIQRRIFST